MSFSPSEHRAHRRYLTLAGACHRCQQPAEVRPDGRVSYLCRACKLKTAARAREQMRRSRVTRAFLVVWYALLPAGLCVDCQQPKERFHPLRCGKCRRKVA